MMASGKRRGPPVKRAPQAASPPPVSQSKAPNSAARTSATSRPVTPSPPAIPSPPARPTPSTSVGRFFTVSTAPHPATVTIPHASSRLPNSTKSARSTDTLDATSVSLGRAGPSTLSPSPLPTTPTSRGLAVASSPPAGTMVQPSILSDLPVPSGGLAGALSPSDSSASAAPGHSNHTPTYVAVGVFASLALTLLFAIIAMRWAKRREAQRNDDFGGAGGGEEKFHRLPDEASFSRDLAQDKKKSSIFAYPGQNYRGAGAAPGAQRGRAISDGEDSHNWDGQSPYEWTPDAGLPTHSNFPKDVRASGNSSLYSAYAPPQRTLYATNASPAPDSSYDDYFGQHANSQTQHRPQQEQTNVRSLYTPSSPMSPPPSIPPPPVPTSSSSDTVPKRSTSRSGTSNASPAKPSYSAASSLHPSHAVTHHPAPHSRNKSVSGGKRSPLSSSASSKDDARSSTYSSFAVMTKSYSEGGAMLPPTVDTPQPSPDLASQGFEELSQMAYSRQSASHRDQVNSFLDAYASDPRHSNASSIGAQSYTFM